MNEHKSGYHRALEAAGAEVLAYKEFGSYQGDWLAKVIFDGAVGWIEDCFGSCSVCDAFEHDMGWDDETPEKLKAFGARYLEDELKSQAEILASVSKNVEWDFEAGEMVKFVKENA